MLEGSCQHRGKQEHEEPFRDQRDNHAAVACVRAAAFPPQCVTWGRTRAVR
jgi:hypothetical protein